MESKMEDPVEIGIFASCPGEGKMEQAITIFDYVKIHHQ
jgi:hypothetical protein